MALFKHFKYIKLFNPPNGPDREVLLLLFPFYREGDSGTEQLSNLLKVPQPVMGEPRQPEIRSFTLNHGSALPLLIVIKWF